MRSDKVSEKVRDKVGGRRFAEGLRGHLILYLPFGFLFNGLAV